MRWILLSLIFLSGGSLAGNLIKGEGRFTAVSGDSHEFIKKQLIFEGIKDILGQELDALGLNKEAFWKKYEESLDEKLLDIELKYKELKKFDEEKSQSRKAQILDTIRVKQLKYGRNYLGLDKLLNKFSIRKISRSQKNPNYRYIRIEGEIDSDKLTKVYYRLIRGKQTSEFGSVFVRTHFNLKGINYAELGIENEKEMTGEVTKNWIEWLIKNKPGNISNIVVMDKDKSEKYDEMTSQSIEKNQESLPEAFTNSLLLDIEVNIIKEKYNDKIKEYQFTYNGYAYLKDIQSSLVLGTYKFGEQEKTYYQTKSTNIANLVANHIYQMGKGSLPRIQRNIKDMNTTSKIKFLDLTNFESINQVHDFVNLAKSRGVKFSLNAKLDSFTHTQAKVVLFYDGEAEEIKALLQGLQSAKKDLSYEVIDGDSHFGIKFNKVTENI